ncbi:MAG: hypothetical protein ACLFVP_08400 [Candidatus Bathyarchaeia archaeon]
MESRISRREKIEKLIHITEKKASIKNKNIETIDELIICARELYPYLPDQVIHDYARTALRIIKNNINDKKATMEKIKNGYEQSTLMNYILQ